MLSRKNIHRCHSLLARLDEIKSWRAHLGTYKKEQLASVKSGNQISEAKTLNVPSKYMLDMLDRYEDSIRGELRVLGVDPDLDELPEDGEK